MIVELNSFLEGEMWKALKLCLASYFSTHEKARATYSEWESLLRKREDGWHRFVGCARFLKLPLAALCAECRQVRVPENTAYEDDFLTVDLTCESCGSAEHYTAHGVTARDLVARIDDLRATQLAAEAPETADPKRR